MVGALESSHDVGITVDWYATNNRQTNIRVNGVDEIAVWVCVNVVDHDNVCCHISGKCADLILPVGSLSGSGGYHFHHFVISEDVSEFFIIPHVSNFEFMER